MNISKSIFAFLAAAAMVGCSEGADKNVDPNPGSTDEMINVTMKASVGAVSTKVDAGLTSEMGLSFTWEDDMSDIITYIPYGKNYVEELTITSIDNSVNSTATFGGEVTPGSAYRLIVAKDKDGITYKGNSTANLNIASQSVEIGDASVAGFDKNVADNMFLINSGGLCPALESDASEIPSVTFAHINSCVVFLVKFADLKDDTDYKITNLTLNNVYSNATIYLNEEHTDKWFCTKSKVENITVDVKSVAVAEGKTYMIPVSVFPGLGNPNATATVWLEETSMSGEIKSGFCTISLTKSIMSNTYAAGTNNAITLDIPEISTLEVTDESDDVIADGESETIFIAEGDDFPFYTNPTTGISAPATASDDAFKLVKQADGSYTITGVNASSNPNNRVEIKLDGVLVHTIRVVVIPKTSVEITGTELVKVSSVDMNATEQQVIDDLTLEITQDPKSDKDYTWEWSVEDSSGVQKTEITADEGDDTNSTVTFMAYPTLKNKTITVKVVAKEDPTISATHVIKVLVPIGFDVTDPDKPGVEIVGPGDPDEEEPTPLI